MDLTTRALQATSGTVRTLRCESHPQRGYSCLSAMIGSTSHSDFRHALPGQVGQHAINADAREQQSQGGEYAEQSRCPRGISTTPNPLKTLCLPAQAFNLPFIFASSPRH